MQYPEYQLFDDTVWSDIGFGPRNQGLGDEEIKKRTIDAIRFTGISQDILEKSPFDLSGGQKRRVAIAGVIAMKPDVLVLDEPAAGLDPRCRREILGGLRKLVDETGTTIILVSHSMEDMAHYCDNVVVMNSSRVYKQGTVSEIFSLGTELTEIGLDIPLVSKIADELIKRGIALDGTLYTVEGVKNAIIEYARREKK
jgi:energy-coupling factor transport system ATP-binding protein